MAASAALLALYLIPSVFGEVINQIFATRWGHIISIDALRKSVTAGLFGTFVQASMEVTDLDSPLVRQGLSSEPPIWCTWFVLFLICAICLAVLSRKVKAYEVVR